MSTCREVSNILQNIWYFRPSYILCSILNKHIAQVIFPLSIEKPVFHACWYVCFSTLQAKISRKMSLELNLWHTTPSGMHSLFRYVSHLDQPCSCCCSTAFSYLHVFQNSCSNRVDSHSKDMKADVLELIEVPGDQRTFWAENLALLAQFRWLDTKSLSHS